jgi:hypothetical protein
VGSSQTLSEADRRIVAVWAADCVERVLGLFEAEAPGESRPRDAIARTRAFGRGDVGVAEQIRRRFTALGAGDVRTPAAAAAARAAGQAAGIPHMGAHALGAAAYAAKAAGLAAPEWPGAVEAESAGSSAVCPRRSEPLCDNCRPSVRTRPARSGLGFSRQGYSARSSVISRPAWLTLHDEVESLAGASVGECPPESGRRRDRRHPRWMPDLPI